MANLLQVSSAFGRAMESVDRARICAAIYPALRAHPAPEHAVAASAEGYAFPTNLDRDAAVDGLTPPSQADLVRQALAEGWDEGTGSRRPWPPTAGSTRPTETASLHFRDGESPFPRRRVVAFSPR